MAQLRTGFLVDTSRCIGCRSCQVACKEWNRLEVDKTTQQGTFENPRDLTPNLYNRIRFVEKADDKGDVTWRFVNERCLHCGDAGCMKVCPAPGALYRTKDGIVGFDKEKCIACKYCVSACPFNVPRYGADDKVSKCHLCLDRVGAGSEMAVDAFTVAVADLAGGAVVATGDPDDLRRLAAHAKAVAVADIG